MKHQSVFSISTSQEQAERIVARLKTANFSNLDISVLLPERGSTKETDGTGPPSRAPQGIVAGAGTGAVVGGTLGWIAGLGVLAIPGFGPLIVAGPLLAALSGSALGAAAGGIAGGLIGLGIPEPQALHYQNLIREGSVLVSVRAETVEEVERAKDIIAQEGARDICTTSDFVPLPAVVLPYAGEALPREKFAGNPFK